MKARLSWAAVVWCAMVAWSIALFTALRADYANFLYARFDLGNMTQAVWSTVHGRPLEGTNGLGEQVSRLSAHVDPILVLVAPFWILAPTPLTLAAVQIAACALGALPVYWLGRAHLGSEKAAVLLALSYLAYPWLAWNALDAMHPVTLTIPLFLFAIWFLDSGRLWAFAACAGLAILCGELIGLLVAALGVWYWLAYKRRRAGLAIAVAGLAASVVAVKIIVPAFGDGSSAYYAHYASVGRSPEGVLETAFTDPGAIAAALTSSRDLSYLGLLLSPLAGAFLLAPGLALMALPQLLAILLSDSSSFTNARYHYTSPVIPFLVAATIFALARMPLRFRTHAATLVLLASVAMCLSHGPLGTRESYISNNYTEDEFADRVSALRSAVALVPDDAPVSSTNAVGSYLSARRYLYGVPVIGRARWIVIEERDAALSMAHTGYSSPSELRRFINATRSDENWNLVMDRDGVLVFRRATGAPDPQP